jgi:hypothetical protein
VVHVRVGQQHEVERRQLARPERGAHQPSRPQLGQAPADSDPRLEGRIGDDPSPLEIEEHGGVAEPGGGEPIAGPRPGLGAMGRRRNPAYVYHEGTSVISDTPEF